MRYLVAFFLLFSSPVFAVLQSVAPLTTQYFSYSGSSVQYPSADLACKAAFASIGGAYTSPHGTALHDCAATNSSGVVVTFSTWNAAGANTCPTATPAYTFNSVSGKCERTIGSPTCTSPLVLNVNTNMCEGPPPGCVTTTLTDGTSRTICGGNPPLNCPPGQIVGYANGIPMCAGGAGSGGNPPPAPPPAPPAPPAGGGGGSAPPAPPAPPAGGGGGSSPPSGGGGGGGGGSAPSAGGGGAGGSAGTGPTTTNVNVDLTPVVGAVNGTTAAVNGTTAAVNGVKDAINAKSISQFCIDHPNNLSCGDSGEGSLPNTPIGSRTVDVTANMSHFSFTGSAACPADRVVSIHGQRIVVSYAPFCDFLSIFRLAALAVGAFAAGMILMGQRSSDSEA